MLQIIQHQRTGEISIEDLPAPQCPQGGVLVRNEYSLISAGTEKATITKAQSTLVERAKNQPNDVKLVLDFIKKDGVISTYRRIKSVLNSYKTLGYSSSGEVILSNCDDFKPGDKVACAGAGYANHSEIIAVPKKLVSKVPDKVSMQSAAYTTVAAIAMQGVRQSKPELGAYVAVIGLGLIGQITVQLLKAAGCKVVGLDINPAFNEIAMKSGCDLVLHSSPESKKDILAFTNGIGCDAVIITAATSSNAPTELAISIARSKGKVVYVGDVPINIPRTPFYLKELEVTIACSYGPGRYDPQYEEQGIDYPIAYVRWTENRNMQSVLELLADGKLNFDILTTHQFDLDSADKAYNLISGESKEHYLGIVLKYNNDNPKLDNTIIKEASSKTTGGVSFIGIGTFAQNYLIPAFRNAGADFITVASNKSINAKSAAEKFGFKAISTSGEDVAKDNSSLVVIATRHDSHSKYVIEAIKAGKDVFVEKPLAITPDELDLIIEEQSKSKSRIMVGFNRRFSKSFQLIKKHFENTTNPPIMLYRVNAGHIPKEHWVQQPEQGGRIIGEVCHFIDTMLYLTGSNVKSVYAESISTEDSSVTNEDNIIITLKYTNGAIGTIIYTAGGDSAMPKEYFEMFSQGKSAQMDNFLSITLYSSGKPTQVKTSGDKGINEEVNLTMKALKANSVFPISLNELIITTKTTFAIRESLIIKQVVEL